MFYSHEILNSRKHGVATIWLVATLGSKSSLKKISRRAILDVDVPKACETISDPTSPMALRLQSSLLYGVSRVFSQQCGYILTDSQHLHDKMNGISMVMRDLLTDTSIDLTRNDQLNLPVDPAFDLDHDMGLDLSVFDITPTSTERSSLLSPHSLVSSRSSLQSGDLADLQLELPSAGTPINDFSGFDFDVGAVTSSVQRPLLDIGTELDEPGIDPDPLFEIDGDVIVEKYTSQDATGSAKGPDPARSAEDNLHVEPRVGAGSGAAADLQIIPDIDFNDAYFVIGDDDGINPLLVHSPVNEPATDGLSQAQSATKAFPIQLTTEEADTVAEAPQRRARPGKIIQMDTVTELSNRQLAEWQHTYLDNMIQARDGQTYGQSLAQARRNAAFWVLDQGIGGVHVNFADDREVHPLSTLSGHALIETLTGTRSCFAGMKRTHSVVASEDEGDGENARRVRTVSEENIARGDGHTLLTGEEDGMLFQGDDEVELQMGRRPASSLKDQPSSMPWNLMGSSRQGSTHGSVRYGISSSAHGIGSDIGPPSIISGRRSRLTSASPLVGRGRPPSRLASLDPQHNDETVDFNSGELEQAYAGLTGELDEDFELYGPAAAVSTQQAAQSQWLAATLENEAHNFLVFVQVQIARGKRGNTTDAYITFENLLPSKQNSSVVAAQGILHVLALATKGLISVGQQEAFGDILLRVVKHDNLSDDEEVEEM